MMKKEKKTMLIFVWKFSPLHILKYIIINIIHNFSKFKSILKYLELLNNIIALCKKLWVIIANDVNVNININIIHFELRDIDK